MTKAVTGGKWVRLSVRFVFIACPVNPCNGLALSTYNTGNTVGILREHL